MAFLCASLEARAVPLFESEIPLEMVLISDFPYSSYSGKEVSPAMLKKVSGRLLYKVAGKVQAAQVTLQARGSGRLNHCRFAPFKLGILQPQLLFAGVSKSIKVVTHCLHEGNQKESESQLLREYATYKMIEATGLPAFKTRLARIHYYTNSDRRITIQYAILIEPKSNLLARDKRLLKEFEEDETEALLIKRFGTNYDDRLARGQLKEAEVVAYMNQLIDLNSYIARSVAQRLILNDDWGGVIESGNVQAMYLQSGRTTGVHYDFDLSALVGKFQNYTPGLRDEFKKDVQWLRQFCTTSTENESGLLAPTRKKASCKAVLKNLAAKKEAISKAIEGVPVLSSKDKAVLLLRTETFARALSFSAGSL